MQHGNGIGIDYASLLTNDEKTPLEMILDMFIRMSAPDTATLFQVKEKAMANKITRRENIISTPGWSILTTFRRQVQEEVSCP